MLNTIRYRLQLGILAWVSLLIFSQFYYNLIMKVFSIIKVLKVFKFVFK